MTRVRYLSRISRYLSSTLREMALMLAITLSTNLRSSKVLGDLFKSLDNLCINVEKTLIMHCRGFFTGNIFPMPNSRKLPNGFLITTKLIQKLNSNGKCMHNFTCSYIRASKFIF